MKMPKCTHVPCETCGWHACAGRVKHVVDLDLTDAREGPHEDGAGRVTNAPRRPEVRHNAPEGITKKTYVGCLRCTKFCLKPTNSPTQGQLNPRKIRLKVAFGPLFPTATIFFVGWDWFYIGNRLQETKPN